MTRARTVRRTDTSFPIDLVGRDIRRLEAPVVSISGPLMMIDGAGFDDVLVGGRASSRTGS